MLPRIAFVGMTHLGLVSATAIAAQGFDVLCCDPDEALVGRLRAGNLPVLEPDLAEMLAGNGARQHFSSDFADLASRDVVYIAPDVPTDDKGISDLTGISALIETVLPRLSPAAILVVLCQVPPGFTRSIGFASDRLYYQVETLIFGRAVERASKPERYIVGCADPERPLPQAFRTLLESFKCPILPMRYESAELAKISINMCLVASISVANTLAEICENIGANWHEIVPALKLDRRIGPYSYLAPGLGIAGGNLERDLATVIRIADRHGTDAGVVKAWIGNSRHRLDWAARIIRETVVGRSGGAAVLGVWGLAYKENTHSVKNSPSLATLQQFPDLQMKLHDPVVPAEAAHHARASAAASPLEAATGVDALAILTPWPEYRSVSPAQLAGVMRGRVVIDPYRVLDAAAASAADLEYHTLGMPAVAAGKGT